MDKRNRPVVRQLRAPACACQGKGGPDAVSADAGARRARAARRAGSRPPRGLGRLLFPPRSRAGPLTWNRVPESSKSSSQAVNALHVRFNATLGTIDRRGCGSSASPVRRRSTSAGSIWRQMASRLRWRSSSSMRGRPFPDRSDCRRSLECWGCWSWHPPCLGRGRVAPVIPRAWALACPHGRAHGGGVEPCAAPRSELCALTAPTRPRSTVGNEPPDPGFTPGPWVRGYGVAFSGERGLAPLRLSGHFEARRLCLAGLRSADGGRGDTSHVVSPPLAGASRGV